MVCALGEAGQGQLATFTGQLSKPHLLPFLVLLEVDCPFGAAMLPVALLFAIAAHIFWADIIGCRTPCSPLPFMTPHLVSVICPVFMP